MGYILNEESMDIVKLARDFAEKEVKPVCDQNVETGEIQMDLYNKAFDLQELMLVSVPVLQRMGLH